MEYVVVFVAFLFSSALVAFDSESLQPLAAVPYIQDNGSDGFCANTNWAVSDDNGSIPDSFYTNAGLKLRVVWTISSLIAASARHYLLQPIISEHKMLDSLVLTDADGQGVLYGTATKMLMGFNRL
ncbi:hypothetical protein CerSpe_220180 [Prunus speciosa]